ncbi:MAG: HEAT repeat domain-containing protein [candidate division Zixibacteria bacterium]|nr:HEAT repeat domain-containing protein [candidate division Zixibacteria bacterium]
MDKIINTDNAISDEYSTVSIDRVSVFVAQLIKTIKTSSTYPSTSNLPNKFKKELFEILSDLIDEAEVLIISVKKDEILFHDEVLYKAPNSIDNIAYQFFDAGIISISFHKGISISELEEFIYIICRELHSSNENDDLVTLFWEASFKNIRYNKVDSKSDSEVIDYSIDDFKSGTSPSDEEIDKIFKNEIMFTDLEDDEDVSDKKNPERYKAYSNLPEHVNNFIFNINRYDESETDEIRELLSADESFGYQDYTINLSFEILELSESNTEFLEIVNIIYKIRNDFIKNVDFHSAANVLSRINDYNANLKKIGDYKCELIKEFNEKYKWSTEIETVVELLNQEQDIGYKHVLEYFKMMPFQAVDSLIYSLGELEKFPARMAVCSAMEFIIEGKIYVLEKGINDPRWYVVRNVIYIMGRLKNTHVVNYLRSTIKHAEMKVREETILSATRIDGENAYEILITALKDQDEKLQLLALRQLVKKNVTKAVNQVHKIVTDKIFREQSTKYIEQYLNAYVLLGGENAVKTIKKTLLKKGFFPSKKRQKLAEIAAQTLRRNESI